MNDEVVIIVRGNPLPKQSFVYTSNGGGYTKKSIKEWQETVGWKAQQEMINRQIFECPVEVNITFWRKDNVRTDVDNLSKNVLDSLKGIVFSDDCQVVQLHLSKRVNRENPGCIIRIAPAKEESWVDQEIPAGVW